jgi:hypothetical protein
VAAPAPRRSLALRGAALVLTVVLGVIALAIFAQAGQLVAWKGGWLRDEGYGFGLAYIVRLYAAGAIASALACVCYAQAFELSLRRGLLVLGAALAVALLALPIALGLVARFA